jgi:aromatic-L-amino-acid/L-tryptophan decarboxylase
MTPEEFRKHGHALVDWIAEYLDGVERYPVSPPVQPGDIRAMLPEHPPSKPEGFESVLADLDRVVLPGITHWQHPSFFAYFPANTSYASILGELASAGLGVNGMSWATSPAATEIETLVLDWMVDLLGLPDRFRSTSPKGGGVIQGTASEAVLCAILSARERVLGGAGNRAGLAGAAEVVVYATAQSHSSIEKAVRIAGIGSDHLRLVPTDASYAMRPDALDAMVSEDLAAGRVPTIVIASVGTTSSMAVDPVSAIAEITQRHGIWLHVDAAMAGIAALCPELRWVNDGLEHADSYATNPHKWMGVNFDCDTFWVADRTALLAALSILPEYLRTAAGEAGAAIDYRDWQIPLGRRFRALKLWFAIRTEGLPAWQPMIREHLALTDDLVSWIEADPRFELAAPPQLNLTCIRVANDDPAAADTATEALLATVNAGGQALLTRTVLDGRPVIRICIGARTTQRRHVVSLWELLGSLV